MLNGQHFLNIPEFVDGHITGVSGERWKNTKRPGKVLLLWIFIVNSIT